MCTLYTRILVTDQDFRLVPSSLNDFQYFDQISRLVVQNTLHITMSYNTAWPILKPFGEA